MNPKIVEFIRKARLKGDGREKIIHDLVGMGLTDEEIIENFREITSNSQPITQTQQSSGSSKHTVVGTVGFNSQTNIPGENVGVGSTIFFSKIKSNKLLLLGLVVVFILIILGPIMLVGPVMWQLGIFNMDSPSSGGYSTMMGFSRLKPQLSATQYNSNGELTMIMTNGAGTTINLLPGESSITEQTSGSSCRSFSFSKENITSGENFLLTASECPKLPVGKEYSLDVKIRYDVFIGGTQLTKAESGIIRGKVE